METYESIIILTEVQSQILRRQEGCGKLQYTPYGKCKDCRNSELCEKLHWITGGNYEPIS